MEVLADLRPIPESPWFMVAKVDASEILAEARYRGGMIALFAALFIVLAAGVTAYGYRHRQVASIETCTGRSGSTGGTERVPHDPVQYRRRSDHHGPEGLVKQMNPAAERLTGWRRSRGRGKPLGEIFRIVNEETRPVVEIPSRASCARGSSWAWPTTPCSSPETGAMPHRRQRRTHPR